MKIQILGSLVLCNADSAVSGGPVKPEKYKQCPGDTWEGNRKEHPGRRICSDGCKFEVCKNKKREDPANVDHCYTQAQETGTPPSGCTYGSPENTCGLDADGVCVYTEGGNMFKKKFTISYYPPKARLASSRQTDSSDPCDNIDHYKLVYGTKKDFPDAKHHDELALVGVDQDGTPCAKHSYPKHQLKKVSWDYETRGLFNQDQGQKKKCLMSTATPNQNRLDISDQFCTTDNYFNGYSDEFDIEGNWHFRQDGTLGKNFCMGDPSVEDDNGKVLEGPPVIHGKYLKVLDADEDEDLCSKGWKISSFRDHPLQSTLPQQNTTLHKDEPGCPQCLKDIGNFACFLGADQGNQCTLAPTKSDCLVLAETAQWCQPEPEYKQCPGDTWEGNRKEHPGRRICSDGCRFDVCERKKHEDPANVDHCYTQAQKNGIPPTGCTYGTPENTCGLDADGVCVYSEIGGLVTV